MIIPVYNAAESIRRAVSSALEQTYAPAEIILVDDGSTDDSPKICDELAQNHPIIQVVHMEDKGVSAARNVGLERASGEFVTFLDADDMLAPEMLQALLQVQKESGAEITGCEFRDGDGKCVSYTGGRIITEAILSEHDTRVWGKLYSRDCIGEIRFREGLTIGEDMLFLMELALQGIGGGSKPLRYTLLKKDLYYYTVNPEGAMEKPFAPSYMDQIRCWDLAHDLLMAKAPGILQGSAADRLESIRIVSAVLVGSKIVRLNKDDKKQYQNEWKSAREALKSYRKNTGSKEYLPKGYPLKAFLMDILPPVYALLFGRKKHN